jgi:hypothetical protein
MHTNTPLTDAASVNPIIAAAFELHTLHGWHFADAVNDLRDRFENDRSCPGSRMFTPEEVRDYFRERGHEVNVIALPQKGSSSSSSLDSSR